MRMKMMAVFLRKSSLLQQVRFALAASPTKQSLHFPSRHLYPFSSSSSSSSSSAKSNSFTVSYLIDSCGLSQKEALSASKFVRFETPERPNSTLAFFNSHGFSESQSSKIVKTRPGLLLTPDPCKTLLPKLEFFYSKGVSRPDVAEIVVSTPVILNRSLENQIIPAFNFLADFYHSEEMAMSVVKRFSRILLFDLHSYVASNIDA